jgi:hypothetical protein
MVYVDPVHFARHSLGFQPDPWQEKVLSWQERQLMMNCSRQSGKSVVAAIRALHQAVFHPHSLVLLVSPSQRQSAELFKKVSDFLRLLPMRPALVEDNKLSLQMQNGSRIVSLPSQESTVRGFSAPALVIEDESARVMDTLFLSLRPMLSVSRGAHILMSTPWGQRGHFHELWHNGDPSWERIQITAEQCPRISAAFLEAERRTTPGPWFEAEYHCVFGAMVDQLYSYEDVMGALNPDLEPFHFGDT